MSWVAKISSSLFKGYNSWITFIFVFAILIRIIYLLVIPSGQVPDEIYVFARIWDLALNQIDPVFSTSDSMYYSNNEYYYPPLYFLLSSVVFKLVFLFKTIPLEFSDAFLASYIYLRFFSLLIFMGSIGLIWKIIQKIDLVYPIKIAVFLFITLLPTFAIFTISPSHNVLLFFFSVFVIYLLIHETWPLTDRKRAWFLGLISGLALLTKFEGLLLPVAVVTYVFLAKKGVSVIRFIFHYLLSAFLVSGWWFLLNFLKTGWFYNRSLFNSALQGYILPFSFPDYFSLLLRWTSETFLFTSGATNNIRLSGFGYEIFYISFLVGVFGLIIKFPSLPRSAVFKRVYFMFAVLALVNLIIFLHVNLQLVFQPQGRYLFPSLLFISLNVVLGLSAWFKKKYYPFLPIFIFILLVFFNIWGLGCLSSFYHGINFTPVWLKCIYYR